MSRRKTTFEFVQEAQQKWGAGTFDYTKTNYLKNDGKVLIHCVRHNHSFLQTPSNHLIFNGCVLCVGETMQVKFRKTQERFITDARRVHGNKYDYSQVKYKTNHDKVIVICPEHGAFNVLPLNHLRPRVDCPKCGFKKLPGGYFTSSYFVNNPEAAFKESILYFLEFTDRTTERIFYKIGVTAQTLEQRFCAPQFEGFWIKPIWQATGPLILMCNLERNIKRIYAHHKSQLEYIFHGVTECFDTEIPPCKIPSLLPTDFVSIEVTASRILIKSGIHQRRLFARKGTVQTISSDVAQKFLEEHHGQGKCAQSATQIGLFIKDELVSVMTFGKPRFRKDFQVELLRFASKKYTVIPGAASKMFQFFIRMTAPLSIISYSDRRWNNGNVYLKLGFTKTHSTAPNYWYISCDGSILSRIKCQKHKLAKLLGTAFDPTKSEMENMLGNGCEKIEDQGQDVFVWSA